MSQWRIFKIAEIISSHRREKSACDQDEPLHTREKIRTNLWQCTGIPNAKNDLNMNLQKKDMMVMRTRKMMKKMRVPKIMMKTFIVMLVKELVKQEMML